MGSVAFLRSRAREASDLDCMSRTRTAIRIRSRSNSARAPKTWKVRFLTIFHDGPLRNHRGHRVRHRWLGRLAQQPTAALDLGMNTPAEHEQAHYAALTRALRPA